MIPIYYFLIMFALITCHYTKVVIKQNLSMLLLIFYVNKYFIHYKVIFEYIYISLHVYAYILTLGICSPIQHG